MAPDRRLVRCRHEGMPRNLSASTRAAVVAAAVVGSGLGRPLPVHMTCRQYRAPGGRGAVGPAHWCGSCRRRPGRVTGPIMHPGGRSCWPVDAHLGPARRWSRGSGAAAGAPGGRAVAWLTPTRLGGATATGGGGSQIAVADSRRGSMRRPQVRGVHDDTRPAVRSCTACDGSTRSAPGGSHHDVRWVGALDRGAPQPIPSYPRRACAPPRRWPGEARRSPHPPPQRGRARPRDSVTASQSGSAIRALNSANEVRRRVRLPGARGPLPVWTTRSRPGAREHRQAKAESEEKSLVLPAGVPRFEHQAPTRSMPR